MVMIRVWWKQAAEDSGLHPIAEDGASPAGGLVGGDQQAAARAAARDGLEEQLPRSDRTAGN